MKISEMVAKGWLRGEALKLTRFQLSAIKTNGFIEVADSKNNIFRITLKFDAISKAIPEATDYDVTYLRTSI